VVAVILTGMLWWGSWLAARIQNEMGIHWQKSLDSKLIDGGKPEDPIYKMRTSPIYIALHTGLKKYVAPAFFALLFVYLGLTFMSHVLFNIQDDAGWVCRETKTKNQLTNLNRGQSKTVLVDGVPSSPEFRTSQLCQSMGVWLERNGKYLIRFDSTDSFRDGDIEASKGFYSTDPPWIWQKALMIAAVPLRRELIRPWFRVVARIGGVGGEENFLDPDITDRYLIDEEIRATRDGELFLFVNDAVIGVPGFYSYFYKNNRGSTKVMITRR